MGRVGGMMWGGWGRKGPEKGGARKGKGQNREPQQGIQEKKGPEKGEHGNWGMYVRH